MDQAAPGQNRQGLSDTGRRDLVGQDKAGGIREDSRDQVEAGESHDGITESSKPINYDFLGQVGGVR